MPKTKPTPGPWGSQQCPDSGDLIVFRSGKRVATVDTGNHHDAELIAAAPDMLEALECSEDCRIAGGYTIFWNSMREKWQPRFQELFEGRELREIDDLFKLDIARTSRAIDKAKGDADVR